MAEEMTINLWDCLVSLSRDEDQPGAERAQRLIAAAEAVRSFGSELTLTVQPNGTWVVEIFSHGGDTGDHVEIAVRRDGEVTVERILTRGDVTDVRRISF